MFEENRSNNVKAYWDGNQNKVIRYYFYSRRGLELFNEFRYLIMVIFGVYYTLKMSHPILLVLMFAISIPVLCIAGWVSVHKMSKVIDWLNVEFSTHWGRYGYELQEKQNKILSEINERIKQIGNNNNNRS